MSAANGGNGGGGLGGGHPRVGPFAAGLVGSSFLGGGLAAGTGIYGARAGLGTLGFPGSASPGRGGGVASGLFPGARSTMTLPPVSSSGSLLPPQPPGPDSSALALAQAYQTRLAALSTVAASLLSKREHIAVALARVQGRAAEVASMREAIEAETLADSEAILHRLRAEEGAKQAILQRDADVLMSDIASIDRFYAALTSYQPSQSAAAAGLAAGGPGGAAAVPNGGGAGGLVATTPLGALYDPGLALEFNRAYPELCAEADRLTGKPIKTDVEVRSDDFQRETASRIDLASKYQALVDLVAAKDRIILQMLKVRRGGDVWLETEKSTCPARVNGERGTLFLTKGIFFIQHHFPFFFPPAGA
jgi:hypothetical protein